MARQAEPEPALEFLPQRGRLEDLDIITPRKKMPRHLSDPAGPKPHEERAVGLFLQLLVGMEDVIARFVGRGRSKAPDHLERVLLEYAKALPRKRVEVEVGRRVEIRLEELYTIDPGQAEQHDLFATLAPRDEVVPTAIKKAERAEGLPAATSRGDLSVANPDSPLDKNGVPQLLEQLIFDTRARPCAKSISLRLRHSLEVRVDVHQPIGR